MVNLLNLQIWRQWPEVWITYLYILRAMMLCSVVKSFLLETSKRVNFRRLYEYCALYFVMSLVISRYVLWRPVCKARTWSDVWPGGLALPSLDRISSPQPDEELRQALTCTHTGDWRVFIQLYQHSGVNTSQHLLFLCDTTVLSPPRLHFK